MGFVPYGDGFYTLAPFVELDFPNPPLFRKRGLTPTEQDDREAARKALEIVEESQFVLQDAWDSSYYIWETDHIMEPVPESESNQAETPTSDLPRQ